MNPRRPYIVPTCRRCGVAGERRRRELFGRVGAVYQCPACGKNLGATPVVAPERVMDLPLYRGRQRKRPNAKGRAYRAFLSSRVWREQQKRILRRDRYRCRLRYEGCCTFRATTAHHKTYERFGGDEYDADLVAACKECNLEERRRRVTRRVLGGPS